MKLKIVVIDLEIPSRTKRLALMIGIPLIAVLAISGVAASAVPYKFGPGDQLTSQSINANFADLDGRISTNGRYVTVLVDGGASYSMGATKACGTTAPQSGQFAGPNATTGYAAAKALCEGVNTCSKSAHMCTSEEVVRMAQLGIGTANGWISTGGSSADPANTRDFTDCGGWTNPATNQSGTVWATAPGFDACSNKYPIVCCD